MIRCELRLARPEDAGEVHAFNERMAQAGRSHRLSLSQPFHTISVHASAPISIERYFCLTEGHIRGGVCIKRMQFRVNGSDEEVAFYGYPLSEGIIDRAYGIVGLMIHKEVLRRYPLLYGLGVGSLEEPIAQLMIKTGWYVRSVPFHFAVVHPAAFLRNLTYLRQRKGPRLLLDVLVSTGLGSVGFSLLSLVQRIRGREPDAESLNVERFDAWEAWADDVWKRVRDSYALIGDRSSAALRALYPTDSEGVAKVRVSTDQEGTIGWAVFSILSAENHKYFGNMKVGVLVDMLAAPENAHQISDAVLKSLWQADVDLIVVNHSSAAWNDAFEKAGLLSWATNFFLFLSPELSGRLDPIEEHSDGLYFTRGDGDGPVNLL